MPRYVSFHSFLPERIQIITDKLNFICAVDCIVDRCPPPGFTADVLPVVYRGFNDAGNIQLHNNAALGDGKVSTICIGGSKEGGTRDPDLLLGRIFFQFHAIFEKK